MADFALSIDDEPANGKFGDSDRTTTSSSLSECSPFRDAARRRFAGFDVTYDEVSGRRLVFSACRVGGVGAPSQSSLCATLRCYVREGASAVRGRLLCFSLLSSILLPCHYALPVTSFRGGRRARSR